MTDKTDIAALTRPVRDRYDWSNTVWRDCDHCGKQHTGTVTAEDGSQVCAHCADQLYWSAWQVLAEQAIEWLETERQRADKAELELIKPLPIGELIKRLEGQTYEKWFSQSDLKGEQAPYGFIDPNAETGGMWVKIRAREGDNFTAPIFTVPQKPIINKEKLCDWLEDEFDITNGQRDALAADFAHCCDCIVSDNKAIDALTNL